MVCVVVVVVVVQKMLYDMCLSTHANQHACNEFGWQNA